MKLSRIISNRTHMFAVLSGFISLAVYIVTLAPGLTFIDSGELTAVANTLGIAHPTGYPVFTLLSWIWSHVPLGDHVYRLNLLSAILCSLGVAALVEAFALFLGGEEHVADVRKKKDVKGGKKRSRRVIPVRLIPVFASFAALSIAFSETYWATALEVEVYPLHCFFLGLLLWSFAGIMFQQGDRRLWIFAFILGLSFSNHMTTILFVIPAAVTFFMKYGFTSKTWKQLLQAIPAFAGGLLPYVYLPWRAASQPFMNWGNPQTLESFVWHVTGKQYRVWMFSGLETAGRQLDYFLNSFPTEFGYFLFPLILIGIWKAFTSNKRGAWLLLLLFVVTIFYSINYDIHDIDSYFLLAYIAAGGWIAYGVAAIITWSGKKRIIPIVAIAAALLFEIVVNFRRVDQSSNYMVEDYTANMFKSFKRGALVFSFQWDYWVSASYVFQQVRKMRQDVTVIDKELLRRSWYLQHLDKYFPELMVLVKNEEAAYRAELYKFEHDLPYRPEVIEQRFNDFINAMIDRSIDRRPIYFTPEMEKHFAPGYMRIPEGLAFRLYRKLPSLDEKACDEFVIRPFPRSGRLEDGMKALYVSMFTNRGIYYYTREEYVKAIECFHRALALRPDDQNALQWKARSEITLKGLTSKTQ